jgi:hypothetical protein
MIIWLMAGCATTAKKTIKETIFYPMPPQTPRLQYLTSITSERDLGKGPNWLDEFILGKTPPEKTIARPFGIAAEKGKIYVVDRTYNKVLIIDLVKREFDYIKDRKGGALMQAFGICVTKDGYKYVADGERGQIVVFNERNEFVRAYGDENQFRPTDVKVYGNKIYVCDIHDNEIEVLDRDTGEVIQKIGETGSQEGTFYKPTHIALDEDGNLYVTDSFNFRVQKFDSKGNFLKSFGYHGDTLGGFARPKGVAVDREGHLYVVDTAFENVQIFDDSSTELLLFFGGFGPAPGSMYLPSGVFIDYENVDYFSKYADKDFKIKYLVYVGNQHGKHKLNVYGFGEWIGPPLMGAKKTEKKG